MLQETLKQATNNQHDYLEQLMFVDNIMNGTLSVEEYKQILTTNYFVHAVLEKSLFENLNPDLQSELQIDKRFKLAALTKDLQELNIDLPNTDLTKNYAVNTENDAAILGALYVLEGATLGGNVIVKKLKVNSFLQPYNLSFYYYQVYGENLVANWKQFCQVLNTSVDTDAYETSIQNALKVFDCFALAQQETSGLQSVSHS
ncbi:MAG: hypothetical protein EOP42_08705 [Sphingobacteriaceae bacterium]|nr:MAG: hypothetical protein EOP42_08705 [Sphingobacteriaceae bacterium]